MDHPQQIGPYQVVRLLGRGAMGQVFEVRHPQVDRPLALKLLPDLFADDKGEARFVREAQLLARVRHRNVLPVHDTGESEHGLYLVTELVEGADLRAVADGQPLSGPQAARIVAELAEGVAALHAQGILHRDLKPANVLLRPEGTPILIDFGLARADDVERLTRTGDFLGTPAYMAPEQATGKPEPRSDVYALAAILYHLLCGRAPFVAASPLGVFKALLHEPPATPASLGIAVDPGLWEICRRGLEKDPAQRQPSALALREELRAWLSSRRPETAAAARRARAPLLLGGLGLALLVSAGLVALGLRGAEPPPPMPGLVASAGGDALPGLEVEPVPADTWDAQLRLTVRTQGSGPLKLHLPGHALPERVRGGEQLGYTIELSEGRNTLGLLLVDQAGREATVELEVRRHPAPPWLQDPQRARPTPPLPKGVRADPRTNVFVHEGPWGEHELVWVPPGLLRGGVDGKSEADTDVPGFFLGRTEVTRAQYQSYCEQTGAPLPPIVLEAGAEPGHPVNMVSFVEATAYCAAAGLRLPTLAERGRAACGDEDWPYPWGKSFRPAGPPRANLAAGDSYSGLMPVGEMPQGASQHGALDLCGNVAEWVSDNPQQDENGKTGWLSAGAAWRALPHRPMPLNVLALNRQYQTTTNLREDYIGFRVARDAQ